MAAAVPAWLSSRSARLMIDSPYASYEKSLAYSLEVRIRSCPVKKRMKLRPETQRQLVAAKWSKLGKNRSNERFQEWLKRFLVGLLRFALINCPWVFEDGVTCICALLYYTGVIFISSRLTGIWSAWKGEHVFPNPPPLVNLRSTLPTWSLRDCLVSIRRLKSLL